MSPKSIICICLLFAISANAQTGRYWIQGNEQTIHFNPNPVKTSRFITSFLQKPFYKYHPYNECKADFPFYPSLYSDCYDSMCMFLVEDSLFSYNRTPIGLIRPFIHTSNAYTPSLILPIPQKKNQYGLIGCFTPDTFNVKNWGWRMHYSQIYYDRNSNYGNIIANKKAIFLKTQITRNMSIQNLNWTPHADGVNLWVLTLKNDSVLQAYLLDSSGISLNPIESKVIGNYDGEIYLNGGLRDDGGTLRPSHDYKHIVLSGLNPNNSNIYSTWLYDFDVKTGKATNGRGIVKHSEHGGTLSKATEFSPKDSFIYISTHTDTLLYAPRLIQHNVYTGKNIQLASFPNMKPDNQWRLYSLQLAPDGKIYGNYIDYGYQVNNFSGNYLACIQYPDRPGAACHFKKDSIFFKYGLSWGLPNNYCYPTVMDAYINPNYTCKDTTVMRIDAKWFSQLKISWGDGDSVVYNNREWLDKPDQKHYYKKQGKYLVKLSGYMPPCNNYHEWQDSIIVLKSPISKGYTITKDTVCKRFTATLKDSTKRAYKLKMDWGNGVDSTFNPVINFSRNYFTSQRFKVVYSVLGKDTLGVKGCKLVFSDSIKPIIYNKPAPNFTINDSTQCLNSNSFDFINTTIDTLNTIYQWDLGDQTYNNKKHIFGKIYLKDSTYKIRLITNTVNNCADTLIKTIEVVPNPKVDFSWGITCNKTKTNFTYTGTKPSIVNFIWNFNNESPSYLENPSYLFTVAGTKKIRLIVNSNNGCGDTLIKDIIIKQQSKANFTANDVCENDSVVFKNLSQDATAYNWKFGDGKNSTLESPKHLYDIKKTTQTFNVTMVAIVANGCSDSITGAVTVSANPVSDFSFTDNNGKGNFTAKQTNISNYHWKFGDGDTLVTTLSAIAHTYLVFPAKYNVCLKTTNTANCASETCKEIMITGSIFKILKHDKIKILPNPNKGEFTIEMNSKIGEPVILEIYDFLGQQIFISNEKANDSAFIKNISLINNPTGIYYIKVKTQLENCTGKLLITK